MTANRSEFGTLPDGRKVEALALRAGGVHVTLLTLGAILNDVRLDGVDHSLTLGTPDLGAYLNGLGYYGAIVGPVANRIGGATALIGGERHAFSANEGTSLLHGGAAGTHARLWQLTALDAGSATLTLKLADGAGGLPGNRRITARCALSGPATLDLTIEAETDCPTLFNLANHSYWNLDGTPSYAGHCLQIAADHYLPVTDRTLPTGEIAEVAGTEFDFRQGKPLTPGEGARIDHNICLTRARGPLRPAAELTGTTGVRLRLETTEPGLQVFDGSNDAGAAHEGHGGRAMGAWSGLALEAQCWPDAPNHPAFPQIEHGPDTPYRQHTRFRFDRV